MNLETAISWGILTKTRHQIASAGWAKYLASPIIPVEKLEENKVYWMRWNSSNSYSLGNLVKVIKISAGRNKIIVCGNLPDSKPYPMSKSSIRSKEFREYDAQIEELFNITPETWTELLKEAISQGYDVDMSDKVKNENVELFYLDCPRQFNKQRFDYLRAISKETLDKAEEDANLDLKMIEWIRENLKNGVVNNLSQLPNPKG